MLLAFAVAASLDGTTEVSRVQAADLIGNSPREVAAALHLDPVRADNVVAIAQARNSIATVADPGEWIAALGPCGRHEVGTVAAPSDWPDGNNLRFVFEEGRLSRIKTLDADYTADLDDDVHDLDRRAEIVVTCQPAERGAWGIASGVIYGPIFGTFEGTRQVLAARQRSRGRALVAKFHLGDSIGNIEQFVKAYQGAVSTSTLDDGKLLVRIRYGTDDSSEDPKDGDFYVEVSGGKAIAIRQGILARASCKLRTGDSLVCN